MTAGLSQKTFGVMFDPTLFYVCKSPIRQQATCKWQSAWLLHMATLIILRGLCGYVWVTAPEGNLLPDTL